MTQTTALQILKTGRNVFLTGEPGSGKTYVLNEYIQYLRSHGISPAITASTGIAATHIGGMTIHSWSGIGIYESLQDSDIRRIAAKPKILKRIEKCEVLIIDEVSMLSAKTLDMVDLVCKKIKGSPLAFGGIQVIVSGDFFQLPPINKYGTNPEQLKQFAFLGSAWQESQFAVCYLSEQYRQDDSNFLDVLTAIRSGSLEDYHIEYIQERIKAPLEIPSAIPRLYTHNAEVDKINAERLAKLPGDAKNYLMNQYGTAKYLEILKNGCLSPENLLLKIGATVMFTKNSQTEKFANGTLGIVRDFDSTGYPVVEMRNNQTVAVYPMEWALEIDGKVRARVLQLPLRLAWAMTIHKSQGMSMDAAAMDLTNVFEYGQGYVALSRVRRLKGLHLFGIGPRAFQIHPEVIKQDQEFKRLSLKIEQQIADISQQELKEFQDQFIINAGGSLDQVEVKPAKEIEDRYTPTLQLWQEGNTISEIAELRGFTNGTIIKHFGVLLDKGLVTIDDIKSLLSEGVKNLVPEISKAIEDSEEQKLAPVYQKYNGRLSYDDLKIVKMLLSK
jgi:ATP-dependent DNA helicase PIF1